MLPTLVRQRGSLAGAGLLGKGLSSTLRVQEWETLRQALNLVRACAGILGEGWPDGVHQHKHKHRC